MSERDMRHVLDRDYATPGRAHHIAFETALAVAFLMATVDAVLPSRDRPVFVGLSWHHARMLPDNGEKTLDADEQLAALRAQTDGTIGVGGAALATQPLRAKLLDELLLCTHPAILGFGRPLCDEYDVPIELALLEQRSFEQGVTMHRYAIRNELEAGQC
ncbi:dihydrofolate reductase family protein [Planotetraspora thailandica]|uniref:dihydrofolate reductase family protein n=1 Tax=Planotetraspora thailandica TaxID=487172 RepID=UPI001EF31421|nr:dihydrofolate reductase family protein [Planotetraspora thailandica]